MIGDVKSVQSALDFRPTRLPEVRRRIQEIHPATRSRPSALTPPEVSRLRERVTVAARDPDADRELRKLTGTLTPRELRTVVGSIGTWDDLRRAVVIIAMARPKAGYVRALWRAWQAYPSPQEIVNLLADMGQRFWLSKALGEVYAAEGAKWLEDEEPVDAIVRWTASRRIGWEELPRLPASPFLADTPLVKRIFLRTLQIGSRWQLVRISSEDVLGGWSEMSGEGLKEACANYLRCVDPSLWDENREALQEIRYSYGLPGARDSRPAFWNRISEERQGDFREYFITQALAQAFRGDTVRHLFWMKLRRQMLDVTSGFAGETEWSLIDFTGFSVLEFFKTGNAAYIYPEGESILRRIRRGKCTYPSEMKRILQQPVYGRSDNRIIHSGRWQQKAWRTLRAWRERYS